MPAKAGTIARDQLFAATSRTTSNSSNDAPEATGFARSPEWASRAGAVTPIGERLLGLPLGHHEVAALTGGGGGGVGIRESPGSSRLRERVLRSASPVRGRRLGDLDCIDLHDCHASDITRAPSPRTVTLVLHDEGGTGQPILLLHGLMGSSRTWLRQVPWIREFGHVYTFDAAGHGRPAPAALTTEAFVEDLTSAVASIEEPMIVIGHSMGGALHAWCFAAAHPEKVCALVLEDMAPPDFRGRTAADWAQMISAWPQPFASEEAMKEFFGPRRRPVLSRFFRPPRRRVVPARRRVDLPRHLGGVGARGISGISGRRSRCRPC